MFPDRARVNDHNQRRHVLGKSIRRAFSETDFTEDLKSIDAPVDRYARDDDQSVPIANSALLTTKLVKQRTLKVYPGLSHGMCTTHADRINRLHQGLSTGAALAMLEPTAVPWMRASSDARHRDSVTVNPATV
jgi:pimeloyl-ACP methyl ester carboxylesterase